LNVVLIRTYLESRRCLLVVAGVVAVLEKDKVVLDHDLSAEDHGQELVIAHVLVHGRHDVSRLLRSDRQMWIEKGRSVKQSCFRTHSSFLLTEINMEAFLLPLDALVQVWGFSLHMKTLTFIVSSSH
jgi:hypothetical protein